MPTNAWEGIDEFVAVAECSQVTAAAERLGVSSSHISRQVARLEERLQELDGTTRNEKVFQEVAQH
ncbi:MAG: helix-turn-helix domain-containing protein, partial [Selenomonadaceae bacterium]